MLEQKQVDIGSYCTELNDDVRFQELVEICTARLSLQMLEAVDSEDREHVHMIYKGLTELTNMMQEFVNVKDQILAKEEE
jgi:hypothetical protein